MRGFASGAIWLAMCLMQMLYSYSAWDLVRVFTLPQQLSTGYTRGRAREHRLQRVMPFARAANLSSFSCRMLAEQASLQSAECHKRALDAVQEI